MSGHAAALGGQALGEGERRALAAYLDEVARWSRRVNLTAARTDGERVRQLVQPVVGARSWARGNSLVDVGSGNGSPGLVLAILCPFRRVTLLEPRTRRWAFLRHVARTLDLSQVTVLKARHDRVDVPAADTVSVRAVALGPPELNGLVAPGGRLLVWRRDAAGPGWHRAGEFEGGVALERST